MVFTYFDTEGNYRSNSWWKKAQKQSCGDQLQQMSLNPFLLILNPLCDLSQTIQCNHFCGLLGQCLKGRSRNKTFFKRKNTSGRILPILAFNLPFSKKLGEVQEESSFREVSFLFQSLKRPACGLRNPNHINVHCSVRLLKSIKKIDLFAYASLLMYETVTEKNTFSLSRMPVSTTSSDGSQ